MRIVMALLGFALVSLTLPPPVASQQAYSLAAVIDTQAQGRLACGNTVKGQEGTQALFGVSDEIAVALEAWSPDAATTLQVKPMVLIKEVDRCSPPLFRALVARERLSVVEIRLLDRQGVHFFTIRLEDALVTRIARTVRLHGLHEEVAFVFRVIHLIDERSGVTASHDFAG
jgi:type VI secretion system Hcp family effector